jgi:hypothetical protein
MNFENQMMLVPLETIERLKQASDPSQTMKSLNDEMQSVLNKPIYDNDKWREYENYFKGNSQLS